GITGESLLTFVIVYVNAAIALLLYQRMEGEPTNLKPVALSCFLIGALFFSGELIIKRQEERLSKNTDVLNAAVIQGNVTRQEYYVSKSAPPYREAITNHYFKMILDAASQGYEYIILPETTTWRKYHEISERLGYLTATAGINIIGGFKYYDPVYEQPFNSILWIDKSGKVGSVYRKQYNIPIIESEYSSIDDTHVLSIGRGAIATPICYEGIYGWLTRKMVNQGGELITIHSNDAGFLRSPITEYMS
ncbi:MAG: hypothetical protein GY771_02800, partial [bacterium]|nr:hypothetical protein [bacterium]